MIMKAALILDGKIINTIVVGHGYTPPDGTTMMPLEEAMDQGVPFAEREANNRKIWPSAADLWNEFTRPEKLAIADSTNPDIRLLHEDLRVRRGEVWSDAAEVQQGLGLLVAVGILTESRKNEITTK
jgi:hypothetical protein